MSNRWRTGGAVKNSVKSLLGGALAVVLLVGVAPHAVAATTWSFPSGSLVFRDVIPGLAPQEATLRVQNLQVSDAGSASGYVTLTTDRYTCSTQSFTGTSAIFVPSSTEPCTGTVDFVLDPLTGALTANPQLSVGSVYFGAPAAGSLNGSGPSITTCSVSVTGDSATVQWDAQGAGITGFSVGVVNGVGNTADVPGSDRQATVGLAGETPGQLQFAIEINNNSALIFPCPSASYFPTPGKPTIDSVSTTAGGLLTVNYAVADPSTVQGIEYRIDSGAWLRPAGTAPVAGAGGSFTVSGLAAGKHSVTLRSVGFDSVTTTVGDPKTVVVPSTASSTKPTPPAPATPVSPVAGTSNGAGSGTNGALAATTGNSGIDAPCLAQNGTLYPNLYSTVGSQLTMVPNTAGLKTPTAFSVVAGSIPPGLLFNRTFGILFGVTTKAGSWSTTIQATFADGSTKSSQFSTRVDESAQNLQYSALSLGVVNTQMSVAPSGVTSPTPATYTLVCGELPTGMKLDRRTGVISGRPTTVVDLSTPIRIAQTSATGKAAASFIFLVDERGSMSISYPAHPHLRAGKRASIRPTVVGYTDITIFRMWKGKLQRGLHLNPRTGAITGRPLHAGPTHTITIVALTRGGLLLEAAPMRISTRR